jgi:hypothetical protein
VGFPLRSVSPVPSVPPAAPPARPPRHSALRLVRHLLLALLINGLLLGYVALCARISALDVQARVLERDIELQRAANAELRGRLAAVTDPSELRPVLVSRGFGMPAGVDRIPIIPPSHVVSTVAPSRPPASPPVALTWLQRHSAQAWRAVCDSLIPPAAASTPRD